jgi:AcrR family transcriptional regulator
LRSHFEKHMAYNEKQLQIITTAERLFANKGYSGTSVRDIAEEANVNVAMISYYFGSKEKLMQAVFEERSRHIVLRIETLLKDDTLSPLDKVNALIDDYGERIMHKQQFMKIMLVEQMLEKNTVVTDSINEMKKRNGEFIEKLIHDGQKKKAFAKNIDTVMLMSTMVGIMMQTYINKDYYRFYNNLQHMNDEAFEQFYKEKMISHTKIVIKSILTHEE